MKSIQAVRERRSELAKEVKILMDSTENKKWEVAHQEKYDAALKEVDELDMEAKRINDANEKLFNDNIETSVRESSARVVHDTKGRSKSAVIFNAWLRGGDKALSAEDWTFVRNTMSTTTTTEGGYTVQSDVAKTLLESLKYFGGMREVARVIHTAQGNPMSFPTSDGTSETGELIPENQTATALDPVFGTIALNVYKFSSKIVAAPIELLQDSGVDIEDFIFNRLVTRIARITNQMFTTGTGVGQPGGVVTGATAGKVGATGQTVTATFGDLIDLIHSVDPLYRTLGRVRFMMNDGSLKAIRKYVDTQNRPIFMPGYDGLGGPMGDMILGYPVTINQDVPVMAANAKSILFGDFHFYIIRDVMSATMFRFTDSAYMKLGQVGFLMWARSGGNLVDIGGAVKYYQNSAT